MALLRDRSRPFRRAMLCAVVLAAAPMATAATYPRIGAVGAPTSPSAAPPPRSAASGTRAAFQHNTGVSTLLSKRARQRARTHDVHHLQTQHPRNLPIPGLGALFGANDDDPSSTTTSSSFLSTGRASVSFKSGGGGNAPSNLSPADELFLALTSDRASLLLGSVGILLLLLNRLASFPEDAAYEASRSRIDLLGVFAAGSVLLNGITKLDVESARAERVALEGVNLEDAAWNDDADDAPAGNDEEFRSTVEWALSSFLKCSPARTAVLLAGDAGGGEGGRWAPVASLGVVPSDPDPRSSVPDDAPGTPILDGMLRDDGGIKGGTVGGAATSGRRGPKESYLPTLQALPGRVEFTYLPPNAQEALLLPVPRTEGRGSGDDDDDGRRYAVVLGGDTAKSFAPRDVAWCREVASWIGELV